MNIAAAWAGWNLVSKGNVIGVEDLASSYCYDEDIEDDEPEEEEDDVD